MIHIDAVTKLLRPIGIKKPNLTRSISDIETVSAEANCRSLCT